MDRTCRRLRPLLFQTVEGEASPDDALVVGRHVHDCTVCRIVLARSRRLAEMVDSMGDPIDVDESFLDRLMDTLPERPLVPEPPRSAGRRRGLKLAGIALLLGLAGGGTLVSPVWPAIESVARRLDGPHIEFGARVFTGVETFARFLMGLVVGAGSGPAIEIPGGIHLPAVTLLVVAIPLAALAVAFSGALSLAAYGVSRGLSPARDR